MTDLRSEATARLADAMLQAFHSASIVPLKWHEVAARIAIEQAVVPAVMREQDHWVRDGGKPPHPGFPWSAVCAEEK